MNMPNRLFVLNLHDGLSESWIRDVLVGCCVTSVKLARTRYGVLASIETEREQDAAKAETILDGLHLPVPLGIVRGDSRIGQKLGEILLLLTEPTPETYSGVA